MLLFGKNNKEDMEQCIGFAWGKIVMKIFIAYSIFFYLDHMNILHIKWKQIQSSLPLCIGYKK